MLTGIALFLTASYPTCAPALQLDFDYCRMTSSQKECTKLVVNKAEALGC